MAEESPSRITKQEWPVQFLKGIGPARAEVLGKYGVTTLRDLLFYVPRRYLDRSAIVKIGGLKELTASGAVNQFYTVVGEVRSFRTVGFRKRSRLVVVIADDTGSLQCVWFGGVQYWKNRFRVGELVACSGSPSYYGKILQFVHPEIDRIADQGEGGMIDHEELDPSQFINTGGLVPLYPSGSDLDRVGLDSAGFRRVIRGVINTGNLPDDILPSRITKKRNLMTLRDAIQQVHRPESTEQLQRGLRRLKYEELFLFQLQLARRRSRIRNESDGLTFRVKSRLARQLVDSLDFDLTAAQVRVIKEITNDMESPHPLHRLLHGDVGSGKTVVALIAMLVAVENGYQAAFMAPTELLAEQHYRTLASFLNGIGVNIRLLVGRQKTRLRRDVLEDVRRGSAEIVVGTHALFEQDVQFSKLGLVVIDEQHRFGVMQRAQLQEKGESPEVLVMTATPIPRTLSMTLYGDLDVSVLDELPRNRRPVETMIRVESEKESVYEFTRRLISAGRQAYFVYPVIEESEKIDLKAATVHFEHLQKDVFPGLALGLIHGRLRANEREEVMLSFIKGEIDILVATTVIEVGIDVPNASLMVIENAERFGLAQLHQLRGRVGRGSERSYCILLTRRGSGRRGDALLQPSGPDETALAEKRLNAMVATSDGFRIAEIDLQLRGPGDFFGTRQSGMPLFRVANLLEDAELLEHARSDAFDLIEHDPQLESPDHRELGKYLAKQLEEASLLMRTA